MIALDFQIYFYLRVFWCSEMLHFCVQGLLAPTKTVTPGQATDATSTIQGQPSPCVQDNDEEDEMEAMTLGPLSSMGLPEEVYLADKTTAHQCLLTITGSFTQVNLHILDDRIAILTEDPGVILDPSLPEEEETKKEAKPVEENDDTILPVRIPEKKTRIPLELEHLAKRWFTPDELINVLMISGVNLFPRDDSGTRVECLEKVGLDFQF